MTRVRQGFAVAALLIAFTVAAHAQSSVCTLKVENAPEVRGLKLGQDYEVVRRGFPRGDFVYGLSDYKDSLGIRRFRYSGAGFRGYPRTQTFEMPAGWERRFEGVEGVELQFLDEKLALIQISYDNSTKWDDPSEFTAAIAQALNLPSKGWRGRYGDAVLDCTGFQVKTEIVLTPRLILKSDGLDEEIERRRAEAEKAKRKVFKP